MKLRSPNMKLWERQQPRGTVDLMYALLRLKARRNANGKARGAGADDAALHLHDLLDPLHHTSDAHDYRLSWLLFVLLRALGVVLSFQQERLLHGHFAAQLEEMGCLAASLAVLQHIDCADTRTVAARRLILHHPSLHQPATAAPVGLVHRLKLCPAWFAEARFIDARNEQRSAANDRAINSSSKGAGVLAKALTAVPLVDQAAVEAAKAVYRLALDAQLPDAALAVLRGKLLSPLVVARRFSDLQALVRELRQRFPSRLKKKGMVDVDVDDASDTHVVMLVEACLIHILSADTPSGVPSAADLCRGVSRLPCRTALQPPSFTHRRVSHLRRDKDTRLTRIDM